MKKYTMETVVGIFVVIGLLCVAYMTVKLGHVSILGESSYPLYAPFTSVSGLRIGAGVDMYGLRIGRVEQIAINQKDQMAVVELRIPNNIKVYDDAIASIDTEGLIGDRYVSLSPGGAGALLKPGGTITQTQPPVNFYDIMSKYIFGTVKKNQE
jgi:phospholipid/cholesterol/gamma-HCH transport system substrate-binding protein